MSTHNLCFEKKYEKISEFFICKFSFFLFVKFSIHLNRHVFVIQNVSSEDSDHCANAQNDLNV